MSRDTNLVAFDHPSVAQHENVTRGMAVALAPYLVHTALAPNFSAAPESASEILHRAFNVSPQFRDARARKGATDEAKSPEAGMVPRGYALKLDGSMPIDSEPRLRHVLAKWDQGLGTSMYAVTKMPDDLRTGATDAQVASVNAAAHDKLPDIVSPSHRIVLARTSNQFDDDEYALFVTANDVAAARQLYQYAAARAASDSPLTITTLANSAEYKLLTERSQCARDTLARQYADALGVTLANDGDNPVVPLRTSTHFSIVPSNQLAHGTFASRVPQDGAHEPEHYTVYNAATPTHEAYSGLLVSHGIMGGVTLLTNPEIDEGWHQPQFLSIMPQDSGAAHTDHAQVVATHRGESSRSDAAFKARVVWRSDYDDLVHVNSGERFYALGDPYSQRWLDKLSPSSDGPIQSRAYTMVTAQLPSISTVYASERALGTLARIDNGPPNITVAIDNDIVIRIVQLWDPVVRPAKYPLSLREVFANAYEENDEGGFRALSRQSLCRNPAHKHSANTKALYADADKYNVSPITGQYRSQTATDELTYLRQQLAATSDFQSRTVLALDKELVRLVTAAQ